MEKTTLACFELELSQEETLRNAFSQHQCLTFSEPLSEKHFSSVHDLHNAEVLIVFIYSRVTRKFIERLPKLKLIVTMSTGFDHIDLAAAQERNIAVCNVPLYGENTVAEHTFALLLALSRKLYPSIKRTHEEHRFDTDKTLRGFDLKGKALGIVGCGSIGMHVARIGAGFGMKLLGFDTRANTRLAEEIGLNYVPLETLFEESDIISLHVPYTKNTHHLINADTLKKCKRGVYLLNTSRGSIIDTRALIHALEEGRVAGAGLDVLEAECRIQEEASLLTQQFKDSCDTATILEDHLLMSMPNVIVTPHNAFNSSEALKRILKTTILNVKHFLSTGNTLNAVQAHHSK